MDDLLDTLSPDLPAVTCLPMLEVALDMMWTHEWRKMGVHRAGFMLLEPDLTGRIEWLHVDGEPSKVGLHARVPLDATSLSGVIARDEARLRSDVAQWIRTQPGHTTSRIMVEEGVHSDIVAPVHDGRGVICLLWVGAADPGALTEQDRQTLQGQADRVGSFFSRCADCRATGSPAARVAANPAADGCPAASPAGLLLPPPSPTAHRALAETTARLREEIRLAMDVVEQINDGLSLDEVLSHIFDSIQQLVPLDRLSYASVDTDGMLTVRWQRSRYDLDAPGSGLRFDPKAEGLGALLTAGGARILPDLAKRLVTHPQARVTRALVAAGIASSLVCPLQVDGRAMGALFFGAHQPHAYGEEHVRIMTWLAGHLALTVHRGERFGALKAANDRSEELIHVLLPDDIARQLRAGRGALAQRFDAVTVLFADMVGFSELAAFVDPEVLVAHLNSLFTAFDEICAAHGVETIKTLGDGYMAAAGLPAICQDHADRAVRAALDMLDIAAAMRDPTGRPLSMRIGLHSGPVVAGVIGKHKLRYDLWGHTVNIASRMESTGESGRVQVSSATVDALRGPFTVVARGPVRIKGHGLLDTSFVERPRPEADGS